jgi:hypothetical protein
VITAVVVISVRYRSGQEGEITEHLSGGDIDNTATGSDMQNKISVPASELKPEPEPELSPVTEPPEEKNHDKAAELIDSAMSYIGSDKPKIIEARETLNEVLLMPINPRQRQYVKQQLEWLADKWLFSRAVFEKDNFCENYEVKPGEMLGTIGRKFKVPWEILSRINSIPHPENLQAGAVIKIIKGPFHAKVHKSEFTMDLYLQHSFVRSFPVGIGQPGKETPTGLWRVESDGKMIEPPWPHPDTGKILYAGDPDYALGSRWIALEGITGEAKGRMGFGIHGTKDPESVGKASSRGCIRLHNGNVILVYDLLVPVFSKVEVVE